MKKIILLSFVITISLVLNSCATKKTNLDLLLGNWVSVEDANSKIEITGDKWIWNITGEETFECDFVICDACAKNIDEKENVNGKFISTFEFGDIYCYEIIKIDEETLELSYTGRGNTLVYKRQ